jgi:hypothetical protein
MEKIRGEYFIHLWDVFNTMDAEEHDTICSGILKNGKACTKKSSMKNAGIMFCKLHAPKESSVLKKKQLVKTMSYVSIATGILKCIEDLFSNNELLMSHIDKVGIELQLTKSPKMKFASHCIMVKLIDTYKTQYNKHIPINFLRASGKLKIKYDGDTLVHTVKSKYTQRKNTAVEYTKHFLTELKIDEKWTQHFKSHSKKDDLSDAALYALIALGYETNKKKRNTRKQ